MHGEEGGAELGHACHALGHGVADVVQLEIEEHLLAGRDQAGREVQPAGEGKLIADLVEPHRFTQARHQRLGFGNRRDIESDDQAFARVERQASLLTS